MPAATMQDETMASAMHQYEPVVDNDADTNERTYALFNHLVGTLSVLDAVGFFSVIGTLVMWQIRKNDSPFLDDHGREAMNFQLSLLLFAIVSFGILIPVLYILRLVGCIRGAMAANRGEFYRYPCCIRFISDPPIRA
ncbi:MAG: DUF4870 domain-containing protein [Planctomycetota bacterium]|jgi:uncharacterized Tic20 family protein